MIQTLRFNSGYPTRLEGIGKRKIIFNPWTNVLFGPNGSGKTTILSALAGASGCGHGGWSIGGEDEAEEQPFSATMERDDHPVFYQDCYLNSEESFFNSDYLEKHAHLRSSGEKRIGLVNELIDSIENRFLTYKHPKESRPTLLLDEVDNHIGFAGQSVLWGDIFPKLSKKYQLIISTHSIFPILLNHKKGLKPDKIISLLPQYPEVCIQELGKAIDLFNEKEE